MRTCVSERPVFSATLVTDQVLVDLSEEETLQLAVEYLNWDVYTILVSVAVVGDDGLVEVPEPLRVELTDYFRTHHLRGVGTKIAL